jgi:hypothetical protein
MQECAQCVAKHGRPGCPATLTDERGLPVCAWCTDLEPCPVEQRRLRAEKKKTSGTPPSADDSEKSASEQKSGVTMKTPETDTNIAPKICAKPGCTIELGPKNRSGKCALHFHWTAPGERTSSAGNGHAVASSSGAHAAANGSARKSHGSNGHAPTNGNGASGRLEVIPDLDATRVDEFIASLTPPTKAKIVTLYLRGEL